MIMNIIITTALCNNGRCDTRGVLLVKLIVHLMGMQLNK